MSGKHCGCRCFRLAIALLVCVGWLSLAQASAHGSKRAPHRHQKRAPASTWWYANMNHQGRIPYGNNPSNYTLWRNVRDYGALGDGLHDDTDAINNATFDGNRCSYDRGCNQETTTPAIIYFPPGTYLIKRKLIMLYYTQFVGDLDDMPVIKGDHSFNGIALLDSDPYLPYGVSWFQNQNNFWRHVRNFVIDMTAMPTTGAYRGIHWQVAQGTSMQNIVFNMAPWTPQNTQQAIFMDNGSGGWGEDLVFNGGGTAIYTGNQQWTWRNLTFNDCGTAIYQNWNWVYLYKSITINNCQVGLDMTQGGGNVITTSSLVFQDSVFNGVQQAGIYTTFKGNTTPIAAGTLVLDNVDFPNTPAAISFPNDTVILAGNQKIKSWVQGRVYTTFDGEAEEGNMTCYEPTVTSARVQQPVDPAPKPVSLLDSTGRFYERAKDLYRGVPASSFISIVDFGCVGDGITDVTTCVQAYLLSILSGQIAFIDHGAYVITNTIIIPNNIKIVGEVWPLFMISSQTGNFLDQNNPQVAFRVGLPGESGAVEMQEIIFETRGPTPGAILMEWNLANEGDRQGANCMWDVHWRLGGSNGTLLQSPQCDKTPNKVTGVKPSCMAAFLMLHLTSTAQVLMSNNWGWLADHDLDAAGNGQINLYNGRGILVESQGPVWLYGTAFEHSMLYNYQVAHAQEIYMGIIQTETAYMQSNPNAVAPFSPQASGRWSDPDFSNCFKSTCPKTWGLRVLDSNYVYLYGGGVYSFFDNYDTGCLITTNCQQNMVSLEQSQAVYLYALNTVGTENMVLVDGYPMVPSLPLNENQFTDTVAVFEYP